MTSYNLQTDCIVPLLAILAILNSSFSEIYITDVSIIITIILILTLIIIYK